MKILVITFQDHKVAKDKLQLLKEQGEVHIAFGEYNGVSLPEDKSSEFTQVSIFTVNLKSYDKKVVIKTGEQDLDEKLSNLLKNFPTRPMEYRPASWRKQVSDGQTLDDFNLIEKLAYKPDIARFILELDVFDQNVRFLDRKKLKLYLQRAFIRADFNARNKKVLFTDKFKFQNWTYGTDFCVGQLTEKPEESESVIVDKLNDSLVPLGIRAKRLEIYSMNVKAADTFEKVLYEIVTDFSISDVNAGIEEFLKSQEYVVKVKVPGMMRGSWVTQEIDARKFVNDLWAEQVGVYTVIRGLTTENVGLYEILPSIMKTSAKNIKRFPVKRLLYLKKGIDGEMDFFADSCEVCDATIEKNVFDESIHDCLCVRHLPFTEQNVSLGTEFSQDDEESDKIADAIPAESGEFFENDGSTMDNSFQTGEQYLGSGEGSDEEDPFEDSDIDNGSF